MPTLDAKTRAKAALADLVELCKGAAYPRWEPSFRTLMEYITNVETPPPAPVYSYEGAGAAGKGNEYELLGPAKPAGILKEAVPAGDVGGATLMLYRDLASGTIYVRTVRDFQARMRRVR